jgi:tRNA 2-selenouridine synthase
MSIQGEMPRLVTELLHQHYDPAYLRSIDRNFTQMPSAVKLIQEGISQDDFMRSAKQIIEQDK